MPFLDITVIPVPTANKAAYLEHSRQSLSLTTTTVASLKKLARKEGGKREEKIQNCQRRSGLDHDP